MTRSFIRWTAFAEGATTSLVSAALVLGAFVPQLGWLSVAGATAVPVFTLWFCVLALVSLAPSVVAIRLGLRAGFASAALSAAALLGTLAILFALLEMAAESGTTVDVPASLSFAGLDRDRPDVTDVYMTAGGEPLRIDVYMPPVRAAAGGNPVLLYVHGGGWYQGGRADGSSDLRWFAERGFVVLSPDYTLATDSIHPWDVVPTEIACAMAWTAAHATTFDLNLGRFAVGGDSAGATLAINAAYSDPSSSCGPVPQVDAVVAASPIVDPITTWNNDTARFMLRQYTGGSPQQFPDRYRAISSFTYIHAGAPPALIMNGSHDHLVPPRETLDFATAARARGVDVSQVIVPFADHSFDLTFGSIAHQVKLMVFARFLRDHLGA